MCDVLVSSRHHATSFAVSQPTLVVLDDCCSSQEEICDKVEQRISSLAEEIRALHTCYNRFAPVDRLGPEILSRVFQVLQQIVIQTVPSKLEWLKVMLICRYWRAVLIDCAVLWTKLTFHTPAFVELMLHRSKQTSLSVVPSSKSENCSGRQSRFWINRSWRRVLRSALSRIGQLHTVGFSVGKNEAQHRHLLELLPALSGSATSMLERLVIFGHNEGLGLPNNFVSGEMLKLKHLHLKSCSFSLRILTLATQLTHLHVDWSCHRRQDRPPGNAFFGYLQNRQHLQTLDLARFLTTDSATFMDYPLVFPALKFLKLQDSTSTVTSLICNLRIPASARVHVVFDDFKKDAKAKFTPLLATPLSFDTFLLALSNSWRGNLEEDPRTAEGVLEIRFIGIAPYSDSSSRMEFSFAGHGTPADLTVYFLRFPERAG